MTSSPEDEMGSHSQYEQIKARLLRNGQLFEDPEFPATARSINPGGFVSRQITWKRPKEISRNPKFFIYGKSRQDLHQGEIGDCWFIAGAACLASTNQKLLERVVPSKQSFDEDYAGIFHFHFWEFGEWVEVVVDDRLPTKYGRPIFGHNRTEDETNEFWVALLEKAYAKFKGSYEHIAGGFINDALVDMTGGVSEKFDLSKKREELRPQLYDLMYGIASMNSMMGCSIDATTIGENALSNGLYDGHAYSITQLATIDVFGKQVRLLRLRNPWGRKEWKGAWGDSSREWSSVKDEQKKKLGLVPKQDGEFWIEYNDWLEAFEDLNICHLFPDGHSKEVAEDMTKRNWEVTVSNGGWVRGISAGGCGNSPYERLFWTNPQYAVTLSKSDDADKDGKCTMIVSLLLKPQDSKERELYSSFSMYKLKYRQPVLLSGQDYDKKALYLYKRPETYMNLRETSGHFKVEPGTYVIIPSTFDPNKEADFFLRVYTETASATEIIDEPTEIEEPTVVVQDKFLVLFNKYAGDEKSVDASELQLVLGDVYKDDLQTGFGIDVSRNLLAMMDNDKTGLLNYEEFRRMLKEINVWKGAFRAFDKNGSGDIDTNELSDVFKAIGFKLSRSVMTSIVRRYGGKKRRLQFEDFVQCCTKIVMMYNIFAQNSKAEGDEPKKMELTLEQWLATTMLY